MRLIALWFGLMAAGGWPCAGSAQDARFDIVTTTAQIADMIEAIGGDRVEASSLMGEGVDPHTYRQTRRDIVKLKDADLIVGNGLYLEAQLEPLLETLADRQPVLILGDHLPQERLLSHSDYAGKFDPHVWMDAGLWALAALNLAEAMGRLWPDDAQTFRDNAETYRAKLIELDAYVRQVIATIPAEARVLITAHDAFNYFAQAYDIKVEGIQGLSTESEAGLRRIEDLVGTLVNRSISAVFVESSVAERNIMALIEGAAAQSHEVSVGGSLFSDAMGAPGSYEGSYIGMLDHNATLIARALGGRAPERGLHGLLTAGS